MGDFWIKLSEALRLSVMTAVGLLCFISGDALYAQAPSAAPVAKTMLVEPPTPLLPAALGKLTRVAEGDSGDGLGKLDAADAPVLTEDGLKRFARSEYGNSNGKDFWPFATISVYKFFDASGATSAYDYFKKPGMRPEKLGDNAVSSGEDLLLRSGVSVVRANFKLEHGAMIALAKELIDHLPKVSGAAGIAPLLPTLLPEKGFDAESVKYALGPAGYQAMGGVLPAQAVGFDKSAEAVTAKSKSGGVLTLLLYPTPQIAGEHGRAVETLLNQQVAAGGSSQRTLGTVMLRREGPMVVLATGAWTAADARKMVEGVHLHSEVSFDKPMPLEFRTEVQKTYSLLESIAIFCGFSAVAMVVLALFFGGGRALIRVMQGKPAASEPEFLRIDLRGTVGKRLGGPEA
jgi:hypothetical protein